MTVRVSRLQQELMNRFTDAPTAVEALEAWLGDPGSIVYERFWSSATYTMTTEEMRRLGVVPNMHETGFKRMGFLRRGPSGRALAFVEAVLLRKNLPPWAIFELDSSNTTIGEIVVGRMGGRRETISVEPTSEFDRMGVPLCVRVEAVLHAVAPGEEEPRPLVAVTERIYEDVLGMRW